MTSPIAQRLCSILVALFAIGAALPGQARAQTVDDEYGAFGYPHRSKLSALALFGVTGNAKLAGSGFDLDATYGLGVRYEKPLNTFFVLGGQLGFTAWVPSRSNDLGAGRSTLLDVAIMPKLRIPFSEQVEIYIAGLAGPCASLGDVDNFGGQTDFGLGWGVAGLAGVQLGLSRWTGISLEAGYALHGFSHEVIAEDPATPGRALPAYDVSVRMRQPWFLLGFYTRS
jgi:hypothetical protein